MNKEYNMYYYSWLETNNKNFIDFVNKEAKNITQFLFSINSKYYLFILDLGDYSFLIKDEDENGNWHYIESLENEFSDVVVVEEITTMVSDIGYSNSVYSKIITNLIYEFFKFHYFENEMNKS